MIVCSYELLNFSVFGEIHSVFDNAVNLVFDNSKLITLLSETRMLLPFSIKIPSGKFGILKKTAGINHSFNLQNNLLKINGRAVLTCDTFNKCRNSKFSIEQILFLENIVITLLEEKKKSYREIFEIDSYSGFIDLLKSKNENIIEFLIGRGWGLTPSGDDILNGIIYYQNNCLNTKSQKKITFPNLEPHLPKTCIFSKNMLEYSINNLFNEFFQLLNKNSELQNRENTEAVINSYGASSGLDTLIGFCAARHILN